MPTLDLSSLTTPELRRLRKIARGTHDGALLDCVEWEIAERAALSSRIGGFPVGVPEPGPEPPLRRRSQDDEPPLTLPRPASPERRQNSLPWVGAGLATGLMLTAGTFLGASALELPDWRLPSMALPRVELARTARLPPAPRKPAPRRPAHTSDAVAGALAPEPFPEAPPVELAAATEAPPAPPELAIPPAPADAVEAQPAETAPDATPEPEPTPPALAKAEAKSAPVAKAPAEPAAEKPKSFAEKAADRAKPPKTTAKGEVADAKATAKDAGRAKADKAEKAVAAKATKDERALTKDKTLAARADAKATVAKTGKSAEKAKSVVKDKPVGKTALAANKTPPPKKPAAKPPAKKPAAASTGEPEDAIAVLLARAEGRKGE